MSDPSKEFDEPGNPKPQAGLFGMVAILVAGVVVAVLYVAREVFVPIILAVLLSFLLAPVVRWLRRLQIGRVTSVGLTVLVAFLAIAGFAAVIVGEVSSLAQELPGYSYNLQTKIRSLPGMVPGGSVFRRAAQTLQELGKELASPESRGSAQTGSPSASNTATAQPPEPLPVQLQEPESGPLQIVQAVVGPLLQPMAAAGLVVVFVIMILLEREGLRDRLLRLAGRGDLHRTTEAMNDAAQRISRYLLSQLVVNVSCGLPIGIGLTVIGIPNAALWAILTVLLRFIPYLGIVIAAAFPLTLAVAVAPGWTLLAWTALLFLTVELIVSNLVEPLVYRGTTGLSSVALIAAATFWTWLWGPIGLLLSTPMTVCLVVLGRHVPQLQFLDVILGNEPVLTPDETFYQRILAKIPRKRRNKPKNLPRSVRSPISLTRSQCLLWREPRRTAIVACWPRIAARPSRRALRHCSKTCPRTRKATTRRRRMTRGRNPSELPRSSASPAATISTRPLRSCWCICCGWSGMMMSARRFRQTLCPPISHTCRC
jgi:predicted PurR-regulated permease PerM